MSFRSKLNLFNISTVISFHRRIATTWRVVRILRFTFLNFKIVFYWISIQPTQPSAHDFLPGSSLLLSFQTLIFTFFLTCLLNSLRRSSCSQPQQIVVAICKETGIKFGKLSEIHLNWKDGNETSSRKVVRHLHIHFIYGWMRMMAAVACGESGR